MVAIQIGVVDYQYLLQLYDNETDRKVDYKLNYNYNLYYNIYTNNT